MANTDKIIVYAVNQNKSQILKEIERPKFQTILGGQPRELLNCQPTMCWGHGHSPVFKDKCYTTLAVGWGPLVQTYVLNDVMDTEQTFFDDGYHVLMPQTDKSSQNESKTGNT